MLTHGEAVRWYLVIYERNPIFLKERELFSASRVRDSTLTIEILVPVSTIVVCGAGEDSAMRHTGRTFSHAWVSPRLRLHTCTTTALRHIDELTRSNSYTVTGRKEKETSGSV